MTAQDSASGAQGTAGWFDASLPPQQQVLGFLYAKWVIGALRALVELKVPDALADGPRTVAQISETTGTDADALYRVLRAVAAAGVLEERTDGSFVLTPVSAGLVSDATDGIRDMFLFASDPTLWRPYENVAHSVRTGEAAFNNVFGMSYYEYTKANPASGAVLDRAMKQNHYPGTDRIFAEFDFGRFPRIADVGGGRGQFLAEVLRRHAGVTGVLADQAHTVADAKETFADDGLADRVEIVPTDFFVEVPAGCDAYFIKHTLHNWADDKAELILRRIREAIGGNGEARLLIVENLLRGPGEWDIGKLIDVESLAVLGGRERSREEWNHLTAAAGFAPANEPVPGDIALLEYRPV
ncbi:O-methyltransferase [Streptomyces sp. SID13666]|uniref:methyltransferase n=1 Tax=Streptomyces TaxID=1883 RepID=UPI001106844D|nr:MULTISPECIES: methyltransferase [Streptomyces]MCZ4097840.1 methyltransferase [Streptomyces sp. H39-C1]NEA57506.1 O-methyltransferase [Streptomyces sp. SID13666]NEA70990.1 O-methyltransferase [Streptomyces sp. SID13588]QNA76753.1 O-methyltransferase [Streptomyces sp. So13.3]